MFSSLMLTEMPLLRVEHLILLSKNHFLLQDFLYSTQSQLDTKCWLRALAPNPINGVFLKSIKLVSWEILIGQQKTLMISKLNSTLI